VLFVSLNDACDADALARLMVPEPLLVPEPLAWPVSFWDADEKLRLSLQPCARRVDVVLAHAQTADLIVFGLPVVAPDDGGDHDDDDDDGHQHHQHHHHHDHHRHSHRSDDDRQSTASVLTTAVSSTKQSGDGLIDERGLLFLSMLKGQGLPPCMVALTGLDALPISKRSNARKRAANCAQYHFGPDIKMFPLDNSSDARIALRHISGCALDAPMWRNERAYVVAATRDAERAPAFFLEHADGETVKLNAHSVAQQALHAAAVAWGAHLEFAPSNCESLLSQLVAGVGGHVADPAQSQLLLAVEGFLRGSTLSPNDTVHVSGVGDFQLHSIEILPDPQPNGKMQRAAAAAAAASDAAATTVFRPDEKIDSLQQFNVPDLTLGEQTWPTEEELAEAEKLDDQKKKLRRLVPRGTSAYQAAWIIDDYGYADSDNDSADGGDHDDDDDNKSDDDDGDRLDLVPLDEEDARLNPPAKGRRALIKQMREEELRRENLDDDDDDDDDDDALDLDDDGQSDGGTLRSMRDDGLTLLERLDQLAAADNKWPDEVDVRPYEIARDIFRGWRGLQSFRASHWDVLENLPAEYARVYQFASFHRLAQVLRRERHKKPVHVGQYVRLVLRVPTMARVSSTTFCKLSARDAEAAELRQLDDGRVDRGEYNEAPDRRVPLLLALIDALLDASTAQPSVLKPAVPPFVVSSLLRHERKVSVMHCLVKRHHSYASIVRNGEPLVARIGFRQLLVRPVFSGHDIGVDKHKYDRFLQRGIDTVASFYGPVCVGPAPVLVLQQELSAETDCIAADGLGLVGVGTVLKPDTNRIVLRKAVLTGKPIRCKKKSAIVSSMFHNPEDIAYFKPIELWTKTGRSGHIDESKGTHGRMKCTFDGVIQQDDTVCMSLYARQFPPWPFVDAELREDAELFARAQHVPLVRVAHKPELSDDEDIEVDVAVGHGAVAGGK
jgi:hypothetical protein